jgi:hypothetical protein
MVVNIKHVVFWDMTLCFDIQVPPKVGKYLLSYAANSLRVLYKHLPEQTKKYGNLASTAYNLANI